MKNLKLTLYTLFLWIPIAAAEYPVNLKGEWIKKCVEHHYDHGIYYTTKLAFFDENIVIYSWKFYDNPNCTELTEKLGEFWEKVQMTFEDSHSDKSKLFSITNTLLNGNAEQCRKALDILMLTKDNMLYFGKIDDKTKKGDHCDTRPTELNETPYTFSRSIDQTIEEYVKPLRRYWNEK